MALVNLAQIKGGLQLRSDVDGLLASYDGSKVTTSIVKTFADAEQTVPETYYNADELLSMLNENVAGIMGAGTGGAALSLSGLDNAIKAINDKLVDDIVKLEYNIAYTAPASGDPGVDDYAATAVAAEELATLVPSIADPVVPAYSADNTPIYDSTGAQVTFNLNTLKFSAAPYKMVIDTTASNKTGAKTYAPYAANFAIKVFPTGTFKFGELGQSFLLDNSELRMIAYSTAIATLVQELASDQDVLDAITSKIGDSTVADQISAIISKSTDTHEVDGEQVAIDYKADDYIASDSKVLSEKVALSLIKDLMAGGAADALANAQNNAARIDAVESVFVPVLDEIAVTGSTATTAFTLTQKPRADIKVEMVINHTVYLEDDAFTVDRDTKAVTWTLTAANDGFDINEALTEKVWFKYYTGNFVARTVAAAE
jgi:hypothetical protein